MVEATRCFCRLLGRALVCAAFVVLAACGSAPQVPEVAFATPAHLTPPAIAVDVARIRLASAPEEAATLALQEAGLDPTAPLLLSGTTAVEATGADGDAVVFAREAAWTPDAIDAVVRRYYLRPGDDRPEAFLFATTTVPERLEYLFGNAWWGVLEARLYAGFAAPGGTPGDPTPYLEHARSVLIEFGADPTDVFGSAQALLDALPRPQIANFRPTATLIAIGLLLGDEVQRQHGHLEWVPGEEIMAQHFGLVDRRDANHVLRPIDYALQLYATDIHHGLFAYLELVDVRLGD